MRKESSNVCCWYLTVTNIETSYLKTEMKNSFKAFHLQLRKIKLFGR